METAVFVEQDCPRSRHRDQDVACTSLLQLARILPDLLVVLELHTEDFPKLDVVWFNQKRLIFQDVAQEFPCGVHHHHNLSALQLLHDLLIDVAGQAAGDAAGQDQHVPLLQLLQFVKELLQVLLADCRPLAVDLALAVGLELDVDAGHAAFQVDKVGVHPHRAQPVLQRPAGKARDKAERAAFDPEIFQDGGDVDALAAKLNLLAPGAVDLPQRKMLHPDDVVERRIKGHGINQINPPL